MTGFVFAMAILGVYLIMWLVAMWYSYRHDLLDDWKWGIFKPKDARSRLGKPIRLVVLNTLALFGSMALWTVDISFFHPAITGLTCLVFSVITTYWGWRLFRQNKNNTYCYRDRWTWIPLPMFHTKHSFWYLVVVAIYIVMAFLDTTCWLWTNYLATWSWLQISVVLSYISMIVAMLLIRNCYRKELAKVNTLLRSATSTRDNNQAEVDRLRAQMASLNDEKAIVEGQAKKFVTEQNKVAELTADVARFTTDLGKVTYENNRLSAEITDLRKQVYECEVAGREVAHITEEMRRGRGDNARAEIVGNWRFRLKSDVLPRLITNPDKRGRILRDLMPDSEI